MDYLGLVKLLLPIVSPLLVAGVKRLAPTLPKLVTPILAPIFGVLVGTLTHAVDPATGAALGLAGVGVREIVDQGRRAAGV